MDLNALKDFTIIAQTGSLLSASEKLGTAVSTLSRRMNALEEQMGIQLIERTPQGIKLTLAGQHCYEQALVNLNALDDLTLQIKGDQKQLKGKLRLSIPPAFTAWWDLIQAFQSRYPEIEIHIIATDRKLDLLADGVDVALRAGDLQTDKLIAKKIMDIRLKLVASPKFIANYGAPTRPEQLAKFPCASWSPVSQTDCTWQLGGKIQPIQPYFSTNEYHHLHEIALSGHAICDLPDFIAHPHLDNGTLIEILPAFAFPNMPMHLVYPRHRYQSSIVRAYIDFCIDWVKQPEKR